MSKATQYSSVEEMLSPAELAQWVDAPVVRITRAPFEAEHFSGNTLEHLSVVTANGTTSFVVKHFYPERDWVMRLTHDTRVREAMLFRYGILAQLPRECCSPIVAVAQGGHRVATLMRDESAAVARTNVPVIGRNDLEILLDALAALHVQFRNDRRVSAPAIGISALQDFVTILSPVAVRGELDAGRSHFVLEAAARGWQLFREIAPGDVLARVDAVQQNSAGLVAELQELPQTLIHGDFKLPNLGILDSNAVVMLDWQDATYGPFWLDAGYFLAVNARRLPCTLDEAAALYKAALERRGVKSTARERDLGLVSGGALRLLWQIGLSSRSADAAVAERARAELEWWYGVIRRAL